MSLKRVIISGGGTGGHIFPAIAIANALKEQHPEINILFIGATGKMEMEKVPQAGFPIVGLTISGLHRKNLLKNITLPLKIFLSMSSAIRHVSAFKPQVVIGVGGYASGPTLQVANWLRIPTLIQEQNSFPGKTNLHLGKKAKAICVAYEGMETYFPKDRIHVTGNPVRKDLLDLSDMRNEGYAFYGLDPARKTVLIMGGSLGARSINEAVESALSEITLDENVQVLWQCGKGYIQAYSELALPTHIKLLAFIERMDFAYAIADVIVSRAGATSISELAIIGKPTILVPSPNVTEDHQTKNALALTSKNAVILLRDNEVQEKLWTTIQDIFGNEERSKQLSSQLLTFAKPMATAHIASICNQLISHEPI